MDNLEKYLPDNVSIHKDFFKYNPRFGSEKKIYYKKIISIRIESVNRETSMYGLINVQRDLVSKITIYQSDADKVNIRFYKPIRKYLLRNKEKVIEKFNYFVNFCKAIEKITFANRLNNYLKTSKKGVIFKYRGYNFCNDKTIMKNGKVILSFDLDKYKIMKDYKKIIFDKKKGSWKLWENYVEFDLTHDEDVVLYILEKKLNLSFGAK